MKQSKIKFITLAIICASIFTSCSTFLGNGITGNGHVITKELKVDAFSQLEIDGVFNVIFKQGTTASVTIEADENIAKLIQAKTSNNILTIDYKDDVSIRKSTKLNLFITVVNITDIDLNIVGDVSVENTLSQHNLDIDYNGVGDVVLKLDCDNLILENSSVGDVTLAGHTNGLELNNSGVGDIFAQNFKSKSVVVDNSGVGDVTVYASKSVSIESSGVGDVYYSGNPKSTHFGDSSVGDIIER
jgi:hypothetical protein